jgi:hypothetical protein
MLFDGTQALVTGNYERPPDCAASATACGPGELGPWARVLQAFAIDPASLGAKLLVATSGLLLLGTGAIWAGTRARVGAPLAIMSATTVWYVPLGTIVSLVTLGSLWRLRRRTRDGAET